MRRIQVEYKDTAIKTYDAHIARTLTESLVDAVIDYAYNNRTYETITIKHGKNAEDHLGLAYSATLDNVVMYFDGFIIMQYELDQKLIDAFGD